MFSPVFWFVLAILTLHRLTQFLAFDEGPYQLAIRWRDWMGAYLLDQATGEPATARGRLAACPYCLGLWVAIPVLVLFALAAWAFTNPALIWTGLAAKLLLLWLGQAGAQSLLQDLSYFANRER